MNQDIRLTLLQRARVASPCSVKWDDMRGDDKVRHCDQCDLNVHNLSAMTTLEAEGLLAKHFRPDGAPLNGRFCGAFFKRADGMILTQDCPVGLARVRAAAKKTFARVAAAIGLLTGIGAALAWTQRDTGEAAAGRLRGLEPLATLSRWMAPHSLPPLASRRILGDMCPGAVMVAPNPPAPAPSPTPPGARAGANP